MNVCRPLSTCDGPKRHPLTPARVLRGVVCLVVFLSTAFMMLVSIGFFTAVLMRLFSIHYSRKTTSFFFGIWLALWPFLFEKINKAKVGFAGESVPSNERVLLIANHRTEVDWMYLWDLALRKGQLGYINEQKCIRSKKYASKNGLPILKNVLLPKSKGFCACLEEMRGLMDAVYDITIGYKHRCPTFLDNAFGVDPSEVRMHVCRIPLNDIPASDDNASSWLMDTFYLKDKLLSDFYSQGHFPREGTEGDLSTMKCLLNFVGVIILTGIFTFAFFTSIWFKIYFFSVCAYMASATHLNIRPSPILAL